MCLKTKSAQKKCKESSSVMQQQLEVTRTEYSTVVCLNLWFTLLICPFSIKMVSPLHTPYCEGQKHYFHHRYAELWHKGYCHVSQRVMFAPDSKLTIHTYFLKINLHFRTSQLDRQAKQLRYEKNLNPTLKYNINSTVSSHFCKFKHMYESLHTDNHRVRGPGWQASERLGLKIPCVDVTSLPTWGPVILLLFYRRKARVWTNIWTTMCGSTRVCWVTGRHCIICHPEAVTALQFTS